MKSLQASAARNEMVEHQIAGRGIRDPMVLDAMRSVPRELFLAEDLRQFAYEDTPLPIGANQTISQPYIVALMTEALGLSGGERVLEIGGGSGYSAAVLAQIAGKVFVVERIEELATRSTKTLQELGYDNVWVLHGDGTLGWPEEAPFDGIVVAAGGPMVPESLKSQLKIGGTMIIPIGRSIDHQKLARIIRRSETAFKQEEIANVRFVPLIGDEGWNPSNPHVGRPIK